MFIHVVRLRLWNTKQIKRVLRNHVGRIVDVTAVLLLVSFVRIRVGVAVGENRNRVRGGRANQKKMLPNDEKSAQPKEERMPEVAASAVKTSGVEGQIFATTVLARPICTDGVN